MKQVLIALLIAAAVTLTLIYVIVQPVRSFETTLETIHADGSWQVNCTEPMNRHNKGDRDDMAYLCRLAVTEKTKLVDEEGHSLTRKDFGEGAAVRIVLTRMTNIKQGNMNLRAKSVTLLQSAP